MPCFQFALVDARPEGLRAEREKWVMLVFTARDDRLDQLAQILEALIEFQGDGGTSHDQSRDEGAKQSFASAPGVMHELEEAEIQRQLLLRDAPVWPQPGA